MRLCLVSTLLPSALCAQTSAPTLTHPVRILLQADKPPLGTPALDMATIVEKLKAFAKDENLVPPAPDGDGWIIGIGLNSQEELDGLLVGGGTIRLTPVHHGKPAPEEAKESGMLVVAWKNDDLCNGISYDLVRQSRGLLAGVKVIPQTPVFHKAPVQTISPPSGTLNPPPPHELTFSQIKVRYRPLQPPYPAEAKKNHVQGMVVVEITVGKDGVPTSAAAVSGPDPLLAYACSWALRWRFDPLTQNGQPEVGHFRLSLNFNLH